MKKIGCTAFSCWSHCKNHFIEVAPENYSLCWKRRLDLIFSDETVRSGSVACRPRSSAFLETTGRKKDVFDPPLCIPSGCDVPLPSSMHVLVRGRLQRLVCIGCSVRLPCPWILVSCRLTGHGTQGRCGFGRCFFLPKNARHSIRVGEADGGFVSFGVEFDAWSFEPDLLHMGFFLRFFFSREQMLQLPSIFQLGEHGFSDQVFLAERCVCDGRLGRLLRWFACTDGFFVLLFLPFQVLFDHGTSDGFPMSKFFFSFAFQLLTSPPCSLQFRFGPSLRRLLLLRTASRSASLLLAGGLCFEIVFGSAPFVLYFVFAGVCEVRVELVFIHFADRVVFHVFGFFLEELLRPELLVCVFFVFQQRT